MSFLRVVLQGDIRGEALRGEGLRGDALRGEALRGEALRGEPRGETLRGEALWGSKKMTANAVGKGKCRGGPDSIHPGSKPFHTGDLANNFDGRWCWKSIGKKQNISQCDLIFQHSLKRQPSFSCMLVTFFHAGEGNPQKRNTCHPPQINISPEKGSFSTWNSIFQPSIFRGFCWWKKSQTNTWDLKKDCK